MNTYSIDRQQLFMQGMQLAYKTRIKTGFNLNSPICIYKVCELQNVTVRFNDINMEGMYDRSPKPRIHLSALRPLGRRAFTCAHELGHHLFGHGSTIDELQTQYSTSQRHPNEILADAFASSILMPTLGLKESFAKRKNSPSQATAIDMYAIACNFGVGQATLVNHLAYGLNLISKSKRDQLGKVTPKMIRTAILGIEVPEPLIFADLYWNNETLDMEKGALVLLPHGTFVDINMLSPIVKINMGKSSAQ